MNRRKVYEDADKIIVIQDVDVPIITIYNTDDVTETIVKEE